MTAHMASALALVLALACGMAQGQQTTQSAVPELKQRAPLGIGDFFFGLQPPLAVRTALRSYNAGSAGDVLKSVI